MSRKVKKIDKNSEEYKRLLDLDYQDLDYETKKGTEEAIAILSNESFWKTKYLNDYGKPDTSPKNWKQAYEEKYNKWHGNYELLLSYNYKELNRISKLRSNESLIEILSDDNFWRDKYYKDYGEASLDKESWEVKYIDKFNYTIINEAVDDILAISLNDIASIRSIVYNMYNRSLSREMRKLSYEMGGCRMRRSESNEMPAESDLSQAWLLDNTEEDAKKMMDSEFERVFTHYNNLTSVAASDTEYYGAMFIGLVLSDKSYIYGTPSMKNEKKIYRRINEPEAIGKYLTKLMKANVGYISIYIFMSPKGKDVSRWVIKRDDGVELGFKDINKDAVRSFLRNIVSSDTIFPIVTKTFSNMRHHRQCGPWVE